MIFQYQRRTYAKTKIIIITIDFVYVQERTTTKYEVSTKSFLGKDTCFVAIFRNDASLETMKF